LLVASLALAALVPGPAAQAACALDPDDPPLTFRQMIKKNKTGEGKMDTLILGKVVDIKDLEPGKGGEKLAKLAVAESPVGYAPLVARVHFTRSPGVIVEDYQYYERRHFYAVVTKRLADGTFADVQSCSQSQNLNRDRFWNLVRFARHH